MVTETYRPAEKAIVQGVNDFFVFGAAAVSSILSGVVQTTLGWKAVNLSTIPLLGLVVIAILWYIYGLSNSNVLSTVELESPSEFQK